MRKTTIALGVAAALAAQAFTGVGDASTATHSRHSGPAGQQHAVTRPPAPAGAVLYDQTAATLDTGAQVLHDSLSPGYDSEGADDFVIGASAGNGWTITQVNADLSFNDLPPDAPLFDVAVYADSAAAPGATPVCSAAAVTGTLGPQSGTGQIFSTASIPLSPPCVVPAPGTYWLSVTPVFNFPPQSFWASTADATIGDEAQWRNPNGAYSTPCSDWSDVSTCQSTDSGIGLIGGGDTNYAFQILGSVNGAGGGCSGTGICLEVTLALADAGNPDACGTLTSLDVTAGDQVNFCYTVTNNSGIALDYQSLSDNVNGTLLSLVAEPLPAGGSLQYNRTVTVSATQTITSTWTAQDELPGYGAATGTLEPGTPDTCGDRLFADGFDGIVPPCDAGTPGDFIEISATGTPLDTDDDSSAAATIPFSFSLYGQSSNQLCIGNNGYILFGTATCPQSGLFGNEALPSSLFSTPVILPWWDDLYTGGNIYTATVGTAPNRQFVVEWYQKNHYDGGDSDPGGITFEVVFGEDGTLAFNYLTTTFDSDPTWDNGGSATIGLQKDGTLANEFSFNTASVQPLSYIDWTATTPSVFTDTDDGVTVNVGVPQIDLQPATLAGSAAAGATTTAILNVGNIGTRDLHWNLDEAPAAHLPPIGSRYALPMGLTGGALSQLKQRPLAQATKAHAATKAKPVVPFSTAPAFAVVQDLNDYVALDAAAPGTLTHIGVTGGNVTSTWGGAFVGNDFGTEFLIGDTGLKKIDTATGAVTTINAGTGGGDVWAGTIDPVSGAMYYVGPSAAQQLFRIDDLSTGTAVTVGAISGSATGDIINAIAIDLDGHMWGIDKTQDTLIAIDKTTGATSLIGSLGFDTEFIAGLAFDYASGTLYLASPDASAGNNMYTVNLTSGLASLIAPIGESLQLEALAIANSGITGPCSAPADVPWLSLAPTSGTTPAAGSVPVTATLSAAALIVGDYHANVCVSSDDPVNAVIAVPVDFTVTAAGGTPPTLSKAFAPASVATGAASTLTITLGNTNAAAATLTATLTDTFPTGLVVATTPAAATTCTGGTVTATAGSGAVSLAAGAAIPGNASCTVTVSVQSADAGSYANSIAIGALQTSAGSNAASADATLTVTPPAAGTFPPDENFDEVTAPALPAGWVPNSGTAWVTTTAFADTAPNSAFANELPTVSDFILDSPTFTPTAGMTLSFNHKYNLESSGATTAYDGAVLEISINGGAFADIVTAGGSFTTGGYNRTVSAGFGSPLAGRAAWSGNSTTFVPVLLTLPAAAAGQPTQLRFRTADDSSDTATGTVGWWIDTLHLAAGTTPLDPPTLSKAFAPASVTTGVPSTLTITLANTNATAATLSAVLTDTFPAGLVVAPAPAAATTCTAGAVTANAGDGSVVLASGAAIPANGSCTVSVNVQSAASGSFANTIAAGALQTDAGNNAAAANATLAVTAPPLAPSVAQGFAPAQVASAAPSTLTITLSNPNVTAATLTAALTETLPANVTVAPTPNAATTCAGGSVTANAGDASLSLSVGAQIPASGSCALSVDVQSATAAIYHAAIAAGDLQTDVGNNATAATANLTVLGTFPAPYCARAFTNAVEPITLVNFAAINNATAPAVNGTPALENFLPLNATLIPGASYTLTARGNSDGSFTNLYRAYFDWNQDGVFSEDASERYELGSIVNSTGVDGKQTSATIAVPAAAVSGPTRMRVVKKYSTAGSACGGDDASGTSYGQAEDYTVTVDPNGTAVTLATSFNPTNADVSLPTTLTLSLGLIGSGPATLTAALTDTLPTGLTVAAAPNAVTTCPAGVITATTGAPTISLAAAAQVPSGGCTVSVDVQPATAAIYTNTLPVGALQTDVGNNFVATSANYQATSPGVATYATGFESPFTAANISGQQGWGASVAADWKVATTHPDAGTQHLRGAWTAAGSGTTAGISPIFPVGTTAYSVASARLAITVAGAGTPFDFAPQDTDAGSVVTRVRFLNNANKDIQVLDPVALVYVNTGAVWTPTSYFTMKVVTKRADKTFELCLNGASVYSGTGFAPNTRNVAFIGTKGTGTVGNILDVDTFTVDNTNTGGCP